MLTTTIQSLSSWGKSLANSINSTEWEELSFKIHNKNQWFDPENTHYAISQWVDLLTEEKLTNWVSNYNFPVKNQKTIGLIPAGNIPMVGFHDILSILIYGHAAQVKLSSKDDVIIPWAIQKLSEIDKTLASKVIFTERLKDFDAVIATGSNNTNRYFEYYFGKYPNILRNGRTSVAVFNGKEDFDNLINLPEDVLRYFGLGCRNISSFLFPKGLDPTLIYPVFESWKGLINHHKFGNNYDYQLARFIVNSVPYFDNGLLLLSESTQIHSPIGTIYYSFYENEEDLKRIIEENKNSIQCVFSDQSWYPNSLNFGSGQQPSLTDYADNIDTLAFLETLGN